MTTSSSSSTTTTTHHNHDASPSIVHDILGLIEQGAALIVDKQYKQAGISLTRALEMNKEILLSEQVLLHETQREHDVILEEASCSLSSLLCCQVLDLVILISKGCEGQQNTTDSQGMVEQKDEYYRTTTASSRTIHAHSAPLVLTASDQLFALVKETPRQKFQLTLSLIIIFNLALCQHLYGICQMKKGCSSYPTLLERAFALYGCSYNLLHQLELGGACAFLALAIVNNEAQVLSIIGKHQEAEELIQVILSGLCCLNVSLGHNMGSLSMSSLFLDGLVHNISQLILKDVATASAA